MKLYAIYQIFKANLQILPYIFKKNYRLANPLNTPHTSP